eukprot:1161162-Pelagomonas_calceolata.AAC.3
MAGDGMGWHQQIYQTVKVCSACSAYGSNVTSSQGEHCASVCVRMCACARVCVRNWQLMDLIATNSQGDHYAYTLTT